MMISSKEMLAMTSFTATHRAPLTPIHQPLILLFSLVLILTMRFHVFLMTSLDMVIT